MSSPRFLLPLSCALLLQGCLSTWMRLEDGTVLAPGRSDFSSAIGSVPRLSFGCPGYGLVTRDTSGRLVCQVATVTGPYLGDYETSYVPVERNIRSEPHFGLIWRLGLLGPFGPFTGLEGGLQAEAATYPLTQEFHLGLGLPGSDSLLAHSLVAGWGIGMWADNSWFLQYAASRCFGPVRAFGSLRATLQATRFDMDFEDLRFQHDRTWDLQAAGGAKWTLGEIAVLPDWLAASVTVDLVHSGYPDFDEFKERQPVGLGMAWTFGLGWGW